MADVIRNAVIRLAIESAQSQLVLPNIEGLIAAQKAAQQAILDTTRAMEQQAGAAAQLLIDAQKAAEAAITNTAEAMELEADAAVKLTTSLDPLDNSIEDLRAAMDAESAAIGKLSDEEMAFTEAVTAAAIATQEQAKVSDKATETTHALTGSTQGLYRGAGNALRGIALLGVATGELDGKMLQAIVAIEGVAGALRGASAMAAFFEVATAPVLAAMTALVGAAYLAEQAWTEEARAEKAAADQAQKNLDQRKKDGDLSIEVLHALMSAQEQYASTVERAADRVMRSENAQYELQKKHINEAASVFELKPLEKMRLARDLNTLQSGGVLNDRELSFVGQHDPRSRDFVQREAADRLGRSGFPAGMDSPIDVKHTADNEKYMTHKEGFEDKNRELLQIIQATINSLLITFRETQLQLNQQKAAAITRDAAASSAFGVGFGNAGQANPGY